MPGRFTISLNQLRFFADHGLYQEEILVGSEFEVDVQVQCKSPRKRITSIDQTINYVEIFRIIQDEFNTRRALLETLTMDIAEKIQEQFPETEEVSITIRKLNPPITNFSGSVAVNFTKRFKS